MWKWISFPAVCQPAAEEQVNHSDVLSYELILLFFLYFTLSCVCLFAFHNLSMIKYLKWMKHVAIFFQLWWQKDSTFQLFSRCRYLGYRTRYLLSRISMSPNKVKKWIFLNIYMHIYARVQSVCRISVRLIRFTMFVQNFLHFWTQLFMSSFLFMT